MRSAAAMLNFPMMSFLPLRLFVNSPKITSRAAKARLILCIAKQPEVPTRWRASMLSLSIKTSCSRGLSRTSPLYLTPRALFRSLLDYLSTSRCPFHPPSLRKPCAMGDSTVRSCGQVFSRKCFSCESRGAAFYGRWITLIGTDEIF